MENAKDIPLSKTTHTITLRDLISLEIFSSLTQKNQDWTIATETYETNLTFKASLRLFNDILSKHTPFEQQVNLEEQKEALKFRVTTGTSVKIRR